MSFGSRLREARIQMQLSQKMLADRIGVANTAISNYEKDISFPNTDILYRLFEILDCDANFLFQDVVKKCKSNITDENEMLSLYRKLNPEGKLKAREHVDDLSGNPKYTTPQKTPNSPISDFDTAMDVTNIALQNTTNKV